MRRFVFFRFRFEDLDVAAADLSAGLSVGLSVGLSDLASAGRARDLNSSASRAASVGTRNFDGGSGCGSSSVSRDASVKQHAAFVSPANAVS